ncbi:MAG: alpha-1,2-fucosyltransferase [Simkaniaceae bacterium]
MRVLFLLIFGLFTPLPANEKPFLVTKIQYQFGNQLFQVAAGYALALDHGYEPLFPDFKSCPHWNVRENYKKVFSKFNADSPSSPILKKLNEAEVNRLGHLPENVMIHGFFQSEKYFIHHKEEILKLFSPSNEILDRLLEKYQSLLSHQKTVALHVRTYLADYGHIPQSKEFHAFPGLEYYKNAVQLLGEDCLYLIFSDRIAWCKKNLSDIAPFIVFIEGNHYIDDFYLMTLCDHIITANSSFSWWAAYLNQNPDKLVITPKNWYGERWRYLTNQIVPKDWIRL